METVLVLGADGVIGRSLPAGLAARGYRVHVLLSPRTLRSSHPARQARLRALLGAGVVIHEGSLDDPHALRRAISASDGVAFVPQELDPEDVRRVRLAVSRTVPIGRLVPEALRHETLVKRSIRQGSVVGQEVDGQLNKETAMTHSIDTIKSFLSNVFDADGVHIDKIDDHFDRECVFHDAQPGMEGVEGYKALMAMFDAATESQGGPRQTNIIADDDLVSIRWVHDLKHVGELMGVPATGRLLTVKGHETYRVRDGRIVENWAIMDIAGAMAQLTS